MVAVILLAQFSLKTDIRSDWTANSRLSLSTATTDFLKKLDHTITIQAFISPDNQYKPTLESLLSRYQSHTKKLIIKYIDPELSPDLVRKLNITKQGEMVISRGKQQSHVHDLSEQSLTNALISVSHNKEQWILFLEGHGERSPFSQGNYNLTTWGEQLKQKGFKFRALNLIENNQIPINTAAIVIASPEQELLRGEIDIINDYINDGGNLLLLGDPDTYQHLSPITEPLDIKFIPGTVIDPNAKLLGINDLRFTLINNYANHPVGKATHSVTLFPQAIALEPSNSNSMWQAISLLKTQTNAWSKAGKIKNSPDQTFTFKQGLDTSGPLSIGYLLTRNSVDKDDKQQRIAIIGDSDFVSNSYIGNVANLDLGVALSNWLAQDDALITIPVKTTIDTNLTLSKIQSLIISLGFLFVVPLLLFLIGFLIWRKRRQR